MSTEPIHKAHITEKHIKTNGIQTHHHAKLLGNLRHVNMLPISTIMNGCMLKHLNAYSS